MKLYFQILSEIQRSLKQIIQEFDEAQAVRAEREKKRILELQDADEREEGPSSSSVGDKDENDEDILEHIGILRNRKSLWKELEHRVLFLIAGTYHDQAFPEDDSGERAKEPVDRELAANEDMYYKWAADLRSELLIEERSHVDDLTTKLLYLGDDIAEDVRGGPRASFSIYIPAAKFKGGILTALIFEKLRRLGDLLNGQWNILDAWRYTIMEAVTKPLEDSNNNDATDKPQGDEFQGGLQNQEDSLIYLDAYSELLLDRKAFLNGDRVNVIHNHKRAMKPLEQTLEQKRKEFSTGSSVNCLRAIINELKSQHNKYRVSEVELGICDAALKECTGHYELQMKILQKLEQEKKQINDLFNARVTYYGQLQVFSDGVNIPPEPEEGFEVERQELRILREQLEMDLRAEVGKKKYMGHLLENQREEQEESAIRDCGICTMGISEGVFAPCGHHFCKTCLQAWLTLRHACPL
jgi:E3 ubiquitin-protein ligase SHPRH